MENLSKIKTLGRNIYLFLSVLLAVIPLYYILYWTLINHLPQTLIAVNVPSTSFSPFPLSMKLQLIGFLTSLLPASSLLYGLLQLRKLFSFYQEGIIFSFENVEIFKSTSKALFVWALLSILYESVKSIVFSVGAPPREQGGQRDVYLRRTDNIAGSRNVADHGTCHGGGTNFSQ